MNKAGPVGKSTKGREEKRREEGKSSRWEGKGSETKDRGQAKAKVRGVRPDGWIQSLALSL